MDNMLMLRTIRGYGSAWSVRLTAVFAKTNFGLVFAAIAFSLIAVSAVPSKVTR